MRLCALPDRVRWYLKDTPQQRRGRRIFHSEAAQKQFLPIPALLQYQQQTLMPPFLYGLGRGAIVGLCLSPPTDF